MLYASICKIKPQKVHLHRFLLCGITLWFLVTCGICMPPQVVLHLIAVPCTVKRLSAAFSAQPTRTSPDNSHPIPVQATAVPISLNLMKLKSLCPPTPKFYLVLVVTRSSLFAAIITLKCRIRWAITDLALPQLLCCVYLLHTSCLLKQGNHGVDWLPGDALNRTCVDDKMYIIHTKQQLD